MAHSALYFPYVRTPENEWFNRVLLYWNSVSTIVPGGLEMDERYVSQRMKELQRVELLHLINPVEVIWKLEDSFEEGFLALVEADPILKQRQEPSYERAFVRVHVFKLGALGEALKKKNLARETMHIGGWELWLDVEVRTANLFMAYLAVLLGELGPERIDPVTDRLESMGALLGSTPEATQTTSFIRQHRVSLLEKVLPAPTAPIPVDELVAFKKAHAGQLAAFRDRVDTALIDTANIADQSARQERMRAVADGLIRERDAIVSEMTRRNWPDIVLGGIAGFGAAAFAVAGALYLNDLSAAVIAAPAVVPAAYAALAPLGKRPDMSDKPLAYAALAVQRFSKP